MDSSPQNTRLLDVIAGAISVASSPYLVITGFALWVIAVYSPGWRAFLLYGGTFTLCAPLPPLVFVLVGVWSGRVSDIHVAAREQRAAPFLIAIGGSLLLIDLMKVEKAPRSLMDLAFVLLVNGVVFLIVTQVWKISIHAASYAAAVLIVTLLVSHYLALLYLGLPFIFWARLRRKRHNLGQALAAVLVVSLTTLLVFHAMGAL